MRAGSVPRRRGGGGSRRAALRRRAFSTAHFSISLCGAALVKWAQWASVRRDVFPGDFCDAMGHFHDDAPKHSYAQTAREVRRHLGVPVERVFAHFPKHPVASGSVAQVYRAVLRPEVATACAARDPEFARRIAAEARRCRRSEAFRVYARGAGASSSAATSATFRNVSSAPRRARFRVFGSASSDSGERTARAAAAAARPRTRWRARRFRRTRRRTPPRPPPRTSPRARSR